MCVILYKPKGIEIPEAIIRSAWENNPDGAGIMVARNDAIEISKGYMKLKPLLRAVKKTLIKDAEGAIHLRVATSGLVDAGNTHPFPVSADVKTLRSTEMTAEAAVMHNGVLHDGEALLSDTAIFVRNILAPLVPIISKSSIEPTLHHILNIPGQRFLAARITEKGPVMTRTGEWVFDAETGLWCSNNSYKPRPKVKPTFTFVGDMPCPKCKSFNTFFIKESRLYCGTCHTVSDPCDNCLKTDCRFCPVWTMIE